MINFYQTHKKEVLQSLFGLFKAYSHLFFINSSGFGFIVFLLTMTHFNIGFCGLLGITFIIFFIKLMKVDFDFNKDSYLLYNPLLVSFGIGYQFIFSWEILFLLMGASLMTFFLTIGIKNILYKYGLPVLSIPFCLSIIIFSFASQNYSKLLLRVHKQENLYGYMNALPVELIYFFQCIGFIIFTPHALVGLLLLMGILYFSRALFFMMVLGFFVGYVGEFYLTHAFIEEGHVLLSYNYLLSSAAICAVFMLPTWKSLVVLPFVIQMNILLNDSMNMFFQHYGIPFYTLSFNLTAITFLYALKSLRIDNFPSLHGTTPEENLDQYLRLKSSRKFEGIKVNLPFKGISSIYQSFEGKWTHKGQWSKAVDFVKVDAQGNRFVNSGLMLKDFYSFGAEVVSPIYGVVHKTRNYLNDNPLGQMDTVNNWGNYILLFSPAGFYVLLAHLKKNSQVLREGDQVSPGTLLAQCGNSGLSPFPHLHLHVQYTDLLGDKTVPFIFEDYWSCSYGKLQLNKIPQTDELVDSIEKYPLKYFWGHSLGTRIKYEFKYKNLPMVENFEMTLKVDQDSGLTFWGDEKGNKLYQSINEKQLSFDHFLGTDSSKLIYFYAFLPLLPFHYRRGLNWEVPVSKLISQSFFHKLLSGFMTYFQRTYKPTMAKMHFGENEFTVFTETMVEGSRLKAKILLNPKVGIQNIETDKFIINYKEVLLNENRGT